MRENKLEYRDQAIGEALHWWVRDEFYLYNLFSNLDESLDVMDISFFSELVFGTFLKQYSVRRTIKGGKTEEKNFLLEIKEKGYESFINGEVGNVDELKNSFNSSTGSVKSALTKFATLCNPSQFVMFDSRSRKGMHTVMNQSLDIRTTYDEIDDYKTYVEKVNTLLYQYKDQELQAILEKTSETDSIRFLKENILVFKLRIIDKLLWFNGYDRKFDKPASYNISQYLKLIEYRS